MGGKEVEGRRECLGGWEGSRRKGVEGREDIWVSRNGEMFGWVEKEHERKKGGGGKGCDPEFIYK